MRGVDDMTSGAVAAASVEEGGPPSRSAGEWPPGFAEETGRVSATRASQGSTRATTLRQRANYRFDSFMSKGAAATAVAVAVSFVVLFATVALVRAGIVALDGGASVERGRGAGRQVWLTWLEMTDPGTQAYDTESSSGVKAVAVLAAVLGIVLLSSVIAIMTTALDEKLKKLREGRSIVVERNHTLILGWNARVPEILAELVEANRSERRPVVVILADRDKAEMDAELREQVDFGTTRIETRSGVPTRTQDLAKVAVCDARSVIVLRGSGSAADGSADQEDLAVLKSVMALLIACPESSAPVVAEIADAENRAMAMALSPGRVVAIDVDDILAKLIVQCSRSEGLSVVYQEALSFHGAELYFDHLGGRAAGLEFCEVKYRLPDGVPLGVASADGSVTFNPDPHLVVAQDDVLIILASDDSAIELRNRPIVAADRTIEPLGRTVRREVERELVIGWTPKTPTIIREFADYVEPGSSIDVVTRNGDCIEEIRAEIDTLGDELDGLDLRLHAAVPHSTAGLEQLSLDHYDNVLLLSQACPTCTTMEHTDSETVTILLRLRKMLAESAGVQPTGHQLLEPWHGEPGLDRARLVTEVLDPDNYELLSTSGADDVVISNALVSSVMAQISEDARMAGVYQNLFSEAGSEIYLKSASLYLPDLPAEVPVADLLRAAELRGEIALGYRLVADVADPSANFGVVLNPDKTGLVRLGPDDKLVVMAEDEL